MLLAIAAVPIACSDPHSLSQLISAEGQPVSFAVELEGRPSQDIEGLLLEWGDTWTVVEVRGVRTYFQTESILFMAEGVFDR